MMNTGAQFERLKTEILARSVEKQDWNKAIQEWKFVRLVPGKSACLCKTDIDYCYIVKNKTSAEEVIIGSTCIKRFCTSHAELVEAADIAAYQAVRTICQTCGKWTKHQGECGLCKRKKIQIAEKAKREEARRQERERRVREAEAAALARVERWEKIKAAIDFDSLSPAEDAFVVMSVRRCVTRGTLLSEKQKAWLRRIILAHPAKK